MLKRVNEILIGKDITRTVALADGATMKTIQENIVEGEVVVLDKNFKVAAAAITYANSDVIYLVEGTDKVLNYYDEPGTALTARELIVSNGIDGARVKTYLGAAYVAKAEKTATFSAITDTIVAGTEYVLRIVYKDMVEHPGQFTQTYRYNAKTGDTSQDVFDGLRARIAKHTGRLAVSGGSRVVGSGTTTLVLTGKPIPECTTGLTDIDEFSMVDFDAYLNYVDSDGVWTEVGTSVAYTAAIQGSGIWEQIRDVEKHTQSYRGINNRTWFPIQTPDFRTVKGAAYGQIIIEHDTIYRSADNQYNKETSKTTVIAIDNEAGTNQGTNIQTRLNSWMASLPTPFAAIAIFS